MRERDQRIAHRLLLADAGDPLAGFFAGEAQLLVAAREELLDVALAARAAPACSLPSSIILGDWLLVGSAGCGTGGWGSAATSAAATGASSSSAGAADSTATGERCPPPARAPTRCSSCRQCPAPPGPPASRAAGTSAPARLAVRACARFAPLAVRAAALECHRTASCWPSGPSFLPRPCAGVTAGRSGPAAALAARRSGEPFRSLLR